MSIHAALEATLPPGALAPRRMDTSVFCDFHDFQLLSAPVRDLIATSDKEVSSMRRYTAVSGHFSLSTLLELTVPSSIGTILREPRARTLSLYLYWRTPKIFNTVQPYKAHEYAFLPLDRFLMESHVAAAVDNQLCRMLLRGDQRIPCDGFIAEADIDTLASDAIAELDTLGFVGILELGDETWQGLAQLFGVLLQPTRLNVTGELEAPVPELPGERLFTAHTLNLITRRNAADQIVYDHALAAAGIQGDERLRLAGSAFANQLVRLGDVLGGSALKHAQAMGGARAEFNSKSDCVLGADICGPTLSRTSTAPVLPPRSFS